MNKESTHEHLRNRDGVPCQRGSRVHPDKQYGQADDRSSQNDRGPHVDVNRSPLAGPRIGGDNEREGDRPSSHSAASRAAEEPVDAGLAGMQLLTIQAAGTLDRRRCRVGFVFRRGGHCGGSSSSDRSDGAERASENGEPRCRLSFAENHVDHSSVALIVASVTARGRDSTTESQVPEGVIDDNVS